MNDFSKLTITWMSLRYQCKQLRQHMYEFPQRIHQQYWKVGNHPFYKWFRMEFQQADHQMTNRRECYRLEDKLNRYQLAGRQRWRNYLNLEYPQQNMPIDRLTFGQWPGWSRWGWRRWERHWNHWHLVPELKIQSKPFSGLVVFLVEYGIPNTTLTLKLVVKWFKFIIRVTFWDYVTIT